MLADKPFAKAFWSLKSCVLINNSLCRKLFSLLESPTTFEKSFKVTSVPNFIPDSNLLSCPIRQFYV